MASVIMLFIVAGILTGGTWSMYTSDHKVASIILAIIAACFFIMAVILMVRTGSSYTG